MSDIIRLLATLAILPCHHNYITRTQTILYALIMNAGGLAHTTKYGHTVHRQAMCIVPERPYERIYTYTRRHTNLLGYTHGCNMQCTHLC